MKLLSILCAAVMGLAAVTAQQKETPTIAGKWSLVSDASTSGPSILELKLDDTKVSGSLNGAAGNFVIAGEYKDGTLTFSMDYQGQLTVAFTGKLQEDGALAGTMDYGQGPIPWKATRVKA